MKKIALISYGYLTVDPRIITLADSFSNHGFEVVCLNISPKNSSDARKSELFRRHKCFNLDIPFGNSLFGYIYSFAVKTLYYLKKDNTLFYIRANNYAKEVVSNPCFDKLVEDVDLFYGCEMFFGAFLAYYAAKKKNKKFVFDIKEFYSEMNLNQPASITNFISQYEYLFIKDSILTPCVSDGIAKLYINRFGSTMREKVILLPNTPKKDKSTSKKINTNPSHQKIGSIKFVLIANFVPEIRGIEYVIDIWNVLRPKNATLTLYLSNLNKKNKSNLLNLITGAVSDSINLLEPISQDDIISVLSDYDVGIIPYLPSVCENHRYCSPGKFGQYLKSGLMILSSDTLNIPDYVVRYKLGAVYSTKCVKSASKVFNEIIENPVNIATAKINASSFFEEHYHWDLFGDKLLERVDRCFT